jgi:O-antigen ligase
MTISKLADVSVRQDGIASTQSRPCDRIDAARFGLTLTTIVVAMALGGSARPLLAIPIDICAAALLGVVVLRPLPAVPGLRLAIAFIAAVTVLVVAQLVPLPIDLWRTLPGRDLPFAILYAVGIAPDVHAMSLDPEATLSIGLQAVVPVALFLAVVQTGARARWWLVITVIAIGCVSGLLGVLQLSSDDFYLYDTPHRGAAIGLFANRNHQALLMQVTLLLLTGWMGSMRLPLPIRLAILAVLPLFAILTVVTTSRAGTLLLAGTLPIAGLLLFHGHGLRRRWIIVLAAAATIALALLALSPQAEFVFARFGGIENDDTRLVFLQETMVAIRRFWPLGSGLGTFVPVYAGIEDLDKINAYIANHAHNDYVELALETGISGVILIAAFVAILIERTLVTVRSGGNILPLSALVCIAVTLLHSTVDYPLRTFTVLTPFAMALGLLYPAIRPDASRP